MFFILKDFAEDFKTDLPQVAIDLLCSPATSTPSERLFSCAEPIGKDHRYELGTDMSCQ